MSDEFKPIGEKVEKVAPVENGAGVEDDSKPVEEIESLCMNCHENVSVGPLPFAIRLSN